MASAHVDYEGMCGLGLPASHFNRGNLLLLADGARQKSEPIKIYLKTFNV